MLPTTLLEGERVELWLPLEPRQDGMPAEPEEQWDVRPARIATIDGDLIAAVTGSWGLAGGEPLRASQALIRWSSPEGIAEWEAASLPATDPAAGALIRRTDKHSQEVVLVLRLNRQGPAGALHQRRRNPRLSVRMLPLRLQPLPADTAEMSIESLLSAYRFEDDALAPVARLTDISLTGAAIVVDSPLEEGTFVALEFELPGERQPFSMVGRIVHPAVALHGDIRPQPDGLPGFRRGVEFLAHRTPHDQVRFQAALSRLLQHPLAP